MARCVRAPFLEVGFPIFLFSSVRLVLGEEGGGGYRDAGVLVRWKEPVCILSLGFV